MRFPRASRVLRPRSLAGQLFAVQAVLLAVVVVGYALFTYVSDRSQAEEAAGRQATAVARAVADSPSVREAIHTENPTAELQPYALQVQHDAEVDFVTIMNTDGIRWTHPDPQQIGQHFRGHIEQALRGETRTETYTGTLGASVRAVTPVEEDGRIIGLVSAGIRVEAITARVQEQLTALIGVAAGALALGALGTYVVNARLRRHTHGMNATELSNMHDYHQAALHAVREGLLMLDGQYRVALFNDGAQELLGLTDDVVGRSVADLGLPTPLTGALLASEPRVDQVHLTATRVLVVNTSPVSGGHRRGTVVTLRDVTEFQSLMGELNSERGFTQALRSQAHEAANRLHTVVSLIELGRADEAVDFATSELELAQALTDQVVAAVSEPVLAALLLGKAAQANERGVELVVSEDSRIDDGLLPESLSARDLVTVLGNLIDNAVDAAQGTAGARVTVTAYTTEPGTGTGTSTGASAGADSEPGYEPGYEPPGYETRPEAPSEAHSELVLRVADTGAGVDPAHAEAVFERGFSTKPAGPGGRGLGLALVRQTVRRNEGTLTVTEAVGGGAEFEVRLPLPTVGSARVGAETETAPSRCASPRPDQPEGPGAFESKAEVPGFSGPDAGLTTGSQSAVPRAVPGGHV
ncbi:sensor histidine kinase [Streptomyces acidicola]|uniref:sensor histidine kinase n=1 Tax=Streptomyces acidicola TaxID=2596892 RepID=UPI0018833837|nr:sensor histidine kinase [Streptomyces acidicola]